MWHIVGSESASTESIEFFQAGPLLWVGLEVDIYDNITSIRWDNLGAQYAWWRCGGHVVDLTEGVNQEAALPPGLTTSMSHGAGYSSS